MRNIATAVVALLASAGLFLSSFPATAAEVAAAPGGVTIPKGYRNWQVVAPSQRDDKDEIRVILGNNIAMKAFRAKKLVHPVTREELDAITDVWVDAAFRLHDRDLKMMGRIVRAQMRRMETGDVTDVTETALAEERMAAAV